jgi:heptosyltransferase-2/heptosyltransferase-3
MLRAVSDELQSPRTADADAPVVVRCGAVGDMVLLTVLLAALAERYRRGVHLLSSGPWTPVLLGHDPAVSELRLLRSRNAPYWATPSQWAAVRWLRAHRGPVYLCDPEPASARLVARAALPAGQLVHAWHHRPDDLVHFADWWLQVARLDAPGCPGPGGPLALAARPRLHILPAWRDEAEAWLHRAGLHEQPLVLVQPGHKKTHKRGRLATAGHDKHWPAERWAAVIRGVWQTLPGAAVLVCGSDNEAGLVQQIVDAAGTPPDRRTTIVNLAAQQPSLQRLGVLAGRAHSMISVDTGPAHVAGAMDCPLVVLYAQAGWSRWRPRAASSEVRVLGPQTPTAGAMLTDIAADQVLDAWRSLPARRAA